ncbi:MAG: oxidoreductase, partial [Desulfovibrionaceae bacterium]|nr:oxidoreductase [Desulfovibrionaceae bacterium]
MTSLLSLTGLTITLGCALLLLAAAKAVQHRVNPRCLILWGALHDAGILIMAIVTQSAFGVTGAWLFVMYQLASRLLAWFGLKALDPMGEKTDFSQFRGMGRIKPFCSVLYALGMLAAIGGSPFLVPEGRAFIVDALLDTGESFGISAVLIMAAATTVFIWLHVDAVRRVWLDPKDCVQNQESETRDFSILGIILAIVVAGMGIFRVAITKGISP